jgi:hypothetical protein
MVYVQKEKEGRGREHIFNGGPIYSLGRHFAYFCFTRSSYTGRKIPKWEDPVKWENRHVITMNVKKSANFI